LGEFLNELSTQGVNLNEIYIYQLKRNNGLVYGVLYGSYPNLTKASAAIADLPEIFKSNKPYPRSVIGIKREIEKIAS
jgi:septal ring-binding cell division protein DamX